MEAFPSSHSLFLPAPLPSLSPFFLPSLPTWRQREIKPLVQSNSGGAEGYGECGGGTRARRPLRNVITEGTLLTSYFFHSTVFLFLPSFPLLSSFPPNDFSYSSLGTPAPPASFAPGSQPSATRLRDGARAPCRPCRVPAQPRHRGAS